MAFTLRYHPDVRRVDLPLLDERAKGRIRRAIEERLCLSPERYGEPLRKTLKGYWKLRVGDYRVVFKIKGKEVWILGVAHRRDAYQKMETRMSR
jgi:mRNA interferase RelE/StbE